MKKILLSVLVCTLSLAAFAQESKGQLDDYRRNSLSSLMIFHPEDTFGMYIKEAFDSIPVSDKYDDHNFGLRMLNNEDFEGVQKRGRKGLIKAQHGKVITSKDVEANAEAILNILNDREEVAKYMVAKWFGMTMSKGDSAVFDTKLIQERGQYNATDLDVAQAKMTTLGVDALADAGEELIGNTFMIVNDITYVTAEERAAAAKATVAILGAIFDAVMDTDLGSTVSDITNDIADAFSGFTVKTHSYLYQLEWNDSIAGIFYSQYYTDTPNPEKIKAFWADKTTFRLKYAAHEYEFDAKTTLKGKYDRTELVKMVCTRSIDKNIAALQLQYEDFKVKTPIYQVVRNAKGKAEAYTAKIGLKEGITEKSKFQVIERIVDPETKRTRYRKIATLKPEKGKIWDNRYNAVTEEAEGSELDVTTFKRVGAGEIVEGMLIVEGEYKKAKEE